MRYQLQFFPRLSVVMVFLILYLILRSPALVGDGLQDFRIKASSQGGTMFLCCLAAAAYAAVRLSAHPAWDSPYSSWLGLTPWRWGQRLPGGPVGICASDAAVVPGLTLLAWLSTPGTALLVPTMFFGIYTLGVIVIAARVRSWCFPIIAMWAFPFVFYPFMDIPAAFVVSLILFSMAHIAALRVLRGFPWNLPQWNHDQRKTLKEKAIPACGWPFSSLLHAEARNRKRMSPGRRFAITFMLALWLSWVAHAFTRTMFRTELAGMKYPYEYARWMIILWTSVLALLLLGSYLNWLLPPVSLLGRIANGWWIIPRFDRVFIAPILMVLLAVFLPRLIMAAGMGLPWIYDLCVFAIAWTAMATTPTFDSWRLTGLGRLRRQTQREVDNSSQRQIQGSGLRSKTA